MKIIWSPLAIEQARDIAAYIALDKPSAAEQWIGEIFSSVERLEKCSNSGRIVPEIGRNNIREIVRGNYRIMYKIAVDSVEVLVVKSNRQNLDSNELEG